MLVLGIRKLRRINSHCFKNKPFIKTAAESNICATLLYSSKSKCIIQSYYRTAQGTARDTSGTEQYYGSASLNK